MGMAARDERKRLDGDAVEGYDWKTDDRPIWQRVYLGRVIACLAVAVGLPLAMVFGQRATAGVGEGPAGPPSNGEPAIVSADAVAFSDSVFSTAPMRIAHQRDSAEGFADAAAFDAVEVDVRERVGDGDFRLMANTDYGYTLSRFLDDCLASGQLAYLDVHYDSDPEGVARMVAERGMSGRTVIQVSSAPTARRVCEANPDALVFLLNGSGDEGAIRTDELHEYADSLIGVNMCGSLALADNAQSVISSIREITGRDGRPMRVSLFAYGRRADVYGCDDLYASLGVSLLMTDLCPERDGRVIEIAG